MSADILAKPRQLEDTPESARLLEREFPEGASELPDGITPARR